MKKSHFSRRAYLLGGTSSSFDMLRFVAHLYKKEKNVTLFEKSVRELLGAKFAFSYGSGRMGLYEVLKAMDVGQGDQVIIPGYTCIAVPLAVIRTGATPVYTDIDIKTLNINVEAAAAAITPRTRVILAQHTFGIPCNLDKLQELANHHNIHLIEDGAHALGAKYRDVYCGNFGCAAVFSTEKTKMISTERGGLVTTNNASLANKLKTSYNTLPFEDKLKTKRSVARWILSSLEYHPFMGEVIRACERKIMPKFRGANRIREEIEFYDREVYKNHLNGVLEELFPTRLAPELALLGLLQLRRLEEDVKHRNRLAKRLIENANKFGWQVPEIDWKQTRPSFIRFPFMVEDRNQWITLLKESGIQAGTWMSHPIHPEGSNFSICQYKQGMCPVAEKVSKRIVNIPINSRIGDWMVNSLEKRFSGRLTSISNTQHALT